MRSRRIVRFFWFAASIAIGAGIGVFIGWSRPVDTANAPPITLRDDYQLDIILMTAEIFQEDNDLEAAHRRLTYLGSEDSVRLVQQAALNAHKIGYSTADLELIVTLSQALTLSAANPAGGSP